MPDKGIDPLAFPGYRLIVELGNGCNGTVYRARELESQRLVALKVYRQELLRRAGFLSGLDSAVLAARKLKHPAAARVYGLAEARGERRVALVMELIGGEVLSRALQRNVRFSVVRALRLARDLAAALEAAHARELTAGALHPGHVVVYGETAKLLGIGWSTIEGLPPEYDHQPEAGRFAPAAFAAPEVLSGARPDSRSDLFALGAVLYHMLTGIVPFRARDLAGLKLERTEGLRWPRGADSLIPSEAIGLVGRSLELDPALRPNAAQFAAAAGRLLHGHSADASSGDAAAPASTAAPAHSEIMPPEPGAEPRLPEPRRGGGTRVRDLLIGAVAATVLIGAGLLLGKLVWGQPEQVPPRSTPTGAPTAGVTKAAGSPASSEVRKPPADDAARREWELILAVLGEKPADLTVVKKRLEKLAADHHSTAWGLRARTRLNELLAAESRARLTAFRAMAARAEVLEKSGKYGLAISLFEPPPAEFAGTELAARCADAARDLRKGAARRYAEISARAERSVRDGDLGAAILDYQAVVEDFGLQEYTGNAAKRVRELGERMEKVAAESLRAQERLRREKAGTEFRKRIEQARSLVKSFDYVSALKVLRRLSGSKQQSSGERRLAASYAELVEDEQKLFARARKRVADGIKELTISMGNSEVLTVRRLDEKGLVAEGETVRTSFKWDRVPGAQVYRAFKLTIDVTNGDEHLALATFAWHRGQKLETENGLKLAAELDPQLKAAAAAQARLYSQVEAIVSPRRGANDGLPESPRRRKTD